MRLEAKCIVLMTLSAALMPACRSRLGADSTFDSYAGGGLSALPQVGVGVEGGWTLWRTPRADIAAEVGGTFQFLSDNDFADDGFRAPDSFTQLRLGLKHSFSPGHKRHFVARYGAAWFKATGEPLIVEKQGEYFGCFGSLGFETDLSAHWTTGPEFRVLLVEGEGDLGFEVVPQFAWSLIYRF